MNYYQLQTYTTGQVLAQMIKEAKESDDMLYLQAVLSLNIPKDITIKKVNFVKVNDYQLMLAIEDCRMKSGEVVNICGTLNHVDAPHITQGDRDQGYLQHIYYGGGR